MYWFSPKPCPVEWYEFPSLVLLTVAFSAIMNSYILPSISFIFHTSRDFIFGIDDDAALNMEDAVLEAVEDMTGIYPQLDWSLDQCGLSSVGLPQLALRLEKALANLNKPFTVTAGSLSAARTIHDVVDIVNELNLLSETDGV